jgi:hypothetical protein
LNISKSVPTNTSSFPFVSFVGVDFIDGFFDALGGDGGTPFFPVDGDGGGRDRELEGLEDEVDTGRPVDEGGRGVPDPGREADDEVRDFEADGREVDEDGREEEVDRSLIPEGRLSEPLLLFVLAVFLRAGFGPLADVFIIVLLAFGPETTPLLMVLTTSRPDFDPFGRFAGVAPLDVAAFEADGL